MTSSLLTGAVNVVAGGALVLGLFRRDVSRRARWLLAAAGLTVLGVLASAAVLADDFEHAARRALYGDDVRVAVRTGVQEVVLTGGTDGRPLDLYLDGRLRVGGHDERRYHEALVHPAMNGPHARVLVLGGGDGLARRVLAPGGRLVVHGGPVTDRARVFWTVETTVRAAGLRTTPYRVTGDGTGRTTRAPRDWGFVLAAMGPRPALRLDPHERPPRTLTQAGLTADARAAERTRVPGLRASTLVHPRY